MGERKRSIINLLARARNEHDTDRIRIQYSMTDADLLRFQNRYHNEIETLKHWIQFTEKL